MVFGSRLSVAPSTLCHVEAVFNSILSSSTWSTWFVSHAMCCSIESFKFWTILMSSHPALSLISTPRIIPSAAISNILRSCFSSALLQVHVLHPYNATGTSIVTYTLFFVSLLVIFLFHSVATSDFHSSLLRQLLFQCCPLANKNKTRAVIRAHVTFNCGTSMRPAVTFWV